jgi:carbamoyltransferase
VDRIVLGLFDGPLGGAALFRTGECIAVAHEDRIIRRAGVPGLPRAAIQAVLQQAGVSGARIDLAVVATRTATFAERCGFDAPPTLLCRIARSLPLPPAVRRVLRSSIAASRRRAVNEALRSELGMSGAIRFLDHHVAHAVGAVCSTGLRSAVVAVMDGGADDVWATMTAFDAGGASRLAFEPGHDSLLGFLDVVCRRLGIPPGLDRYRRLEELGARGTSVHYDPLEGAFCWRDGHLSLDEGLFQSGGMLAGLPKSARKEDVAASALSLVCEFARRWVVHWFVRTDQATLVLAGDLFEVPSVARAVLDAPEIRHHRLSVIPGDMGLPLAAAYAAWMPGLFPEAPDGPPQVLSSPFVGTSYSDQEVEKALFREYAECRRQPRIEADVARILTEGRTVARFDGASEIGDRGLGNRVVLRSPVGSLHRGRIGFSLAPGAYHVLIREEAFSHYFHAAGAHGLDLQCQPALVPASAEFAATYPELLGWRGRVLVQTVARTTNPRLHDLLLEFESWSGLPFLAAAPYRLPNQPLVASPRDAVRVFRLLGADFAALGPFLVPSFHESGVRMISTPSSRHVGP